MTTNLTTLEQKVLTAMKQNAESCSGGDFGIMEELRVKGLTRQQLGGLITSLQTKGQVQVWEPTLVNGREKVTQFTFPEGV